MSARQRRMVALILGQSNVGNHGPVRASAGHGVSVLAGDRLVPAEDPLPGATGDGGSVWTRFAPRLIDAGLFDEVVLVPAAIGGTAVADWMPDGPCHRLIADALDRIARAGLKLTHVFWHQGERDTLLNTSGESYRQCLLAVTASLRRQGVTAPIVLCVASYRFGITNEAVRQAQREIVSSAPGMIAGPDTDTIGGEFRYDDCHLDADGQTRFADMLFDCLVQADGTAAA